MKTGQRGPSSSPPPRGATFDGRLPRDERQQNSPAPAPTAERADGAGARTHV